ncbi:hypothetical protein [Streptomyces sp. NPDC047042]|uniref:NucA/NucB deoxyribonuclease domain-containing protein n=1 Tax=Streptomyces sp. NPDC047042 TaxID=3154807 RepID=UPI0033E5B328
MTAASATADEAPSASAPPTVSYQEREAAANKPRLAPKRADAKTPETCDVVQQQAAADGKKQALCIETLSASEVPKQLKSVRSSAAGPGIVWCDDKELGEVYVTRSSICEQQLIHAILINTQTGAPLGDAYLTVKQEVNTRDVADAPMNVYFDEYFYLQVQAVSGALVAGFNVTVDADCAPTSACEQGPDPWTGPTPVTLLSEIDGTWLRSWKNTTLHDTLLLGYTLTVSQGAAKSSHSWGVNESNGWQVRCDNEISKYAGCIIPAFIPTFVIDYAKYPAGSDYINQAQLYIKSYPGLEGDGQPLHREADDTVATKNRNKVCDSTFKPEDKFNKKYEIQCDEYPFARTKESGAQLGITSGSQCKQFTAWPGLKDQEPRQNYIMQATVPHGTANCARASMLKADNEGIGGDLGRFYVKNRIINNDPFWVKAPTWRP